MKKLSICIPTYNRAQQLSELQANFLTQALDQYQEHIDVIVMDQSNDRVSTTIQQSLDSRVIYYRNSEKGYAANINALLNQANSSYIWLISDDDHIVWSGFEAAMLEVLKNESDCIMLPIRAATIRPFFTPIAAARPGIRRCDSRHGALTLAASWVLSALLNFLAYRVCGWPPKD